ncbi:MAG TPA: winged helix-turn-helix transcriptional regulator [Methanomassiliicoccales archaeon]|jgi:DNA-binding Lrp family transcriptional regulator
MDDTDLLICKQLFNNSRLSQRDLADALGLTVAAVHRRVESLIEEGIIKEFTANISNGYLKAMTAQVEGICECRSVDAVAGKLEKSGSIVSILVSSANLTTASLLLREISDLGPTVEHIRTALQMQQPKVTISARVFVGNELFEKEYTGNRELSRIDYRIINALHHNSRKLVVDIAEETGITPKTIRNHIEQMEKESAIEYTLVWNPAYSGGADFVLRIDLKPGVDKAQYISTLNQRFGSRVILTLIHSNMLDYVCGYCWAPTIAKQQEFIEAVRGDQRVVDVRTSMVHKEWQFETWRDRLLKERAALKREA